MAVVASRVSVGTTPTALNADSSDPVSGTVIVITNGATAVDIGGSTVATGTGYPLAANGVVGPIPLTAGEVVYGVTAAGTSTVSVLRLGA
jgi:uncharacterized Zn-binding protein involved in type VI secretion